MKIKQINIGIMLIMAGLPNVYANFVADSKSAINLRNFYFDRQFSMPQAKDTGSWSQGVMARYESGYTDTPLQVSVDASLKYALRLTDHNQQRADTNLPFDTEQNQQYRDYAKYGLTLKLKYNNTELKVGELNPRTPVVYIDESRQLPTSYAGIMLESSEITNLKVTAGRITHINSRNDNDYEKLSLHSTGPRLESDGLNLLGLDYTFTPNFKTSYWFGQLEDIYQQNYFSASYSHDFNDLKLKLDSNYFHNKEEGKKLYGKIDSQAVGLMATLSTKNHMLSTGVQKNIGDSIFPTLAGYPPQPYLQAWSNLPFNNPEEFIWHMTYSYDFKDLGLNGLKSRLSYHHGSGIQRKDLLDNKETEKIVGLLYVIPEGKLKGLGLEWRYTEADFKYGALNNPGNDFKENRFITTYTFNF
ncbi:outer membrane OprD family porin [Acinetobacter calcoaceticus]|uniref:Outer membrane OprD family porin n=1 Tax=Acinetobacter calcoaceticus TaxID=471 RepID=A0A4R1XSR7_ACICA|nr:outer membrane OprD family porin [Acinetobacter calcoaceticus]